MLLFPHSVIIHPSITPTLFYILIPKSSHFLTKQFLIITPPGVLYYETSSITLSDFEHVIPLSPAMSYTSTPSTIASTVFVTIP